MCTKDVPKVFLRQLGFRSKPLVAFSQAGSETPGNTPKQSLSILRFTAKGTCFGLRRLHAAWGSQRNPATLSQLRWSAKSTAPLRVLGPSGLLTGMMPYCWFLALLEITLRNTQLLPQSLGDHTRELNSFFFQGRNGLEKVHWLRVGVRSGVWEV